MSPRDPGSGQGLGVHPGLPLAARSAGAPFPVTHQTGQLPAARARLSMPRAEKCRFARSDSGERSDPGAKLFPASWVPFPHDGHD